MIYVCILLSVVAGLWTGLLLPQAMHRLQRRQEHKAVREAEWHQEKLLDEWLYGDKTEIGG